MDKLPTELTRNDYPRHPVKPQEWSKIDWMMDRIDKLERNSLEVDGLRRRIDALEFRDHQNQIVLTRLESSKLPDIVPQMDAKSAVDDSVESLYRQANGEPLPGIDLNPMVQTSCGFAPPDPKSHSVPYLMSPAWGRLPFMIEAALSEGIPWTCISDRIKTLIDERKTGALNISNAG